MKDYCSFHKPAASKPCPYNPGTVSEITKDVIKEVTDLNNYNVLQNLRADDYIFIVHDGKTYRASIEDIINNREVFITFVESLAGQIEVYKTNVTNRVDTMETKLTDRITTTGAALAARIDTIIANATTTAGNSELIDIRTGADGTVYASAGTAVRSQIDAVNANWKYNAMDILKPLASYTSRTHNGITFTWSEDHKSCNAAGTASSQAFVNMLAKFDGLPNGFEPGEKYWLNFSVTASVGASNKGAVLIYTYKNGANTGGVSQTLYKPGYINIPEETTGIVIRLIVGTGMAVNLTFSNISVFNALPNSELEALLSDTVNINLPMITALTNQIKRNNFDLMEYLPRVYSVSRNGITIVGDKYGVNTINGTSTADTSYNFYFSETELPSWLEPGRTYAIKCNCSIVPGFAVRVYGYMPDSTWVSLASVNRDSFFTVPEDIVGLYIRILVYEGHTFNNDTCVFSIENYDGVGSEILASILNFTTGTHNGVTYSWTNKVCTLSGAAPSTGGSLFNLYYNETVLPADIKPGKSYHATYKTSNEHIQLNVRFWTPHGVTNTLINSGKVFTVPSEAVGMQVRLYVPAGYNVNGATVRNIHFYEGAANKLARKIISIVDDDTSSNTFVTRFYESMVYNGIVGNYACLSYRLDNGTTSAEKLLTYEAEGFGILTHAYYQNGAATWSETGSTRDFYDCRADLAKAVRKMRSYGFANPHYFITPGGNMDAQMERLARMYGFKCMVGTNNHDWNRPVPSSRYKINRHGFSPESDGAESAVTTAKALIDAFVADTEGGWLVMTTHFNAWESVMTYDPVTGYSALNEVINYAKSKGCEFVSFPEGFSYIEPFCID